MKISVQGREYPLPEFDTFNFIELRTIKQVTGLVLTDLGVAFETGDADAIYALALVAKLRNDGDVNVDALNNLAIKDVQVVVDEEDAVPLDETPKEESSEGSESPEA